MARCRIDIYLGSAKKSAMSIEVESSQTSAITREDVRGLLADEDARTRLVNMVRGKMMQLGAQARGYHSYTDMGNLQGNYDIEGLCGLFPGINVPVDIDAGNENVGILVVDNLGYTWTAPYGRVVKYDADGTEHEVFVIRNDPREAERLLSFLSVRRKVTDNSQALFTDDDIVARRIMDAVNRKVERESREEARKRAARKKAKSNVDNEAAKENDVASEDGTTVEQVGEDVVTEAFRDYDSMLLDFMYGKSRYYDIYVKDENGRDVSATVYLNRKLNVIFDNGRSIDYSDDFVNDFSHKMMRTTYRDGIITVDALYQSMRVFHNDVLESLGIDSLQSFMRFFSESGNGFRDMWNEKVVNELARDPESTVNADGVGVIPASDGRIGYAHLLESLLSTEVEFQYAFSKLQNNGRTLAMRSSVETFRDLDIGYDTIRGYNRAEAYKGFNVYSTTRKGGNTVYYASRLELDENSQAMAYESLEALHKAVDAMVENQYMNRNSFSMFHTIDDGSGTSIVTSGQPLRNRALVNVIDIVLDPNVRIEEDVMGMKLGEVRRYLRGNWVQDDGENPYKCSSEALGRILDRIENCEQMFLFLHKVNEVAMDPAFGGNGRSRSDAVINKAWNEVSTAIDNGTRRYYIERMASYRNGQHRYRVTKCDNESAMDPTATEGNVTPTMRLFLAMRESFGKKLDMEVELLTSREIQDLVNREGGDLRSRVDVNTTKAFIYTSKGIVDPAFNTRKGGGTRIVINTSIASASDMLHEYAHLFLGILKHRNIDNYEYLMQQVMNTKEGMMMFEDMRERYGNMDHYSLVEEAFAELYARHLDGDLQPGGQQTGPDGNPVPGTDIIGIMMKAGSGVSSGLFNGKSLAGKGYNNINTVLRMFDSGIADMLRAQDEGEKLRFSETLDYRKYSQWLSDRVKDKEIIERCF